MHICFYIFAFACDSTHFVYIYLNYFILNIVIQSCNLQRNLSKFTSLGHTYTHTHTHKKKSALSNLFNMLIHYLNVYQQHTFGWRYYHPPSMLDIMFIDIEELRCFQSKQLSLSLQPHIRFIYEKMYYPTGVKFVLYWININQTVMLFMYEYQQ